MLRSQSSAAAVPRSPDARDRGHPAHEVLMSVYAAQHQNDAAEREYRMAMNLYKSIDPGFRDLVNEPRDPAAKH